MLFDSKNDGFQIKAPHCKLEPCGLPVFNMKTVQVTEGNTGGGGIHRGHQATEK